MIIRQEQDSSRIPGLQCEPVRATSEPVVEIHRMGEEVKVITELPGMTMDTIDLELRGSTLCIDAGESPKVSCTDGFTPGGSGFDADII